MTKKASKKKWEAYWGSKESVQEVYSNEDRIVRNLEKVIDIKGLSILEVGAGTGRDSFPLVKRGASVFQIDYSYESLRLMRESAENHFVCQIGGNAFRLPFYDKTFDVVFHQGLLEHFREEEAEKLLKENLRVLKNGGYILVDVPQRYHPYTILKHFLIAINKWFAGWERSFSYTELRYVIEKMEMKPVHIYGEWMVPSLGYRVIREIGKKIGIYLPLYPLKIPVLHNVRLFFRSLLMKVNLQLYFGAVIGIVAVKSEHEGNNS